MAGHIDYTHAALRTMLDGLADHAEDPKKKAPQPEAVAIVALASVALELRAMREHLEAALPLRRPRP